MTRQHLRIKEMNLRLSGHDPAEARSLARAVAEELAHCGGGRPAVRAMDRLAVNVTRQAHESRRDLARRIARQLSEKLA